jgi:hypothetical protein
LTRVDATRPAALQSIGTVRSQIAIHMFVGELLHDRTPSAG